MGGEPIQALLGDYVSFRNGKSSPERCPNFPFKVYGSNGIIGCSDQHNAPEKCFVIGRVGSYCGSVHYSEELCWVSDNAIIGEAKKTQESEFWYFMLKKLKLNNYRGGSGQPLLNQTTLRSIPVEIPKESVIRERIGKIGFTLNQKIHLNHQTNRTLEAMAQALFKSWFVDFDPVIDNALAAGKAIPEPLQAKAQRRQHVRNNPDLPKLPKDIQNLFPDEFEWTEAMGWVPRGWGVSDIGSEFDVTMGQSPPGHTYNEAGDGTPFFQGRADFAFRFPNNRMYCTEPKRMARRNDTLVSVRAPVGDVNMANKDCCIGRGLSAVRHRSGSSTYTFYSMLQLSEHFKVFESEGTVFGSINQKDFKGLPNLKVDPLVLKIFDELAGPKDYQIELSSHEIVSLTNLRDTLLPKLISGELSIPDAEMQLKEVV